MNQSTMRKLILFVQILFVIGCAAGIYFYVQSEIEPKKAYIYNKDLEANTIITKDDISTVSIPAKAITKGFAIDNKDIVNKYLKLDVVADSFVYQNQLVKKDGIDRFKSMDLSRLRLLSVPVKYETAVGGDLKKGDKIDLMFIGTGTYTNRDGKDQMFSYSKVFFQNLDVYALNTDDGNPYKAKKPGDYEAEGEEVNSSYTGDLATVTLAVTVEQAEEIEARLSVGEVKVLGRFSDSKSYENAGYVIGSFDKIYSGPVNGEIDTNKIVEDDAYDK